MKAFSSPHIHGGDSVAMTMLSVILALIPAAMVSVYLFGFLAVILISLCMLSCLLAEYLCLRWMKRSVWQTLDGSAALTGLLLALTLPPSLPWWMAVLASMVAIVMSKQVYGGLGYNPFNPALAGRVVLLISFPLQMTTWIVPMPLNILPIDLYDLSQCASLIFFGVSSLGQSIDSISMASPLGYVKTEALQGVDVITALTAYDYTYLNAFLGLEAGSLGETSALALMLGGVFLLARHTIDWHIPLAYLLTVAVLAAVANMIDPQHYPSAWFHLFAGGLMLCAFFMATDPVTSPMSSVGKWVFAIGCGVLTWCIRTWGGYPEGAMFSVLLMNCVVPLIDQYCRPKVYGYGKKS